ncbi:MAG: hypothetical protein A2W19_05805 [Spirochaetes bacterium RBG_16_49_21]|nr:MAG: hypothetical protein A2W19_05805 [Spirochaetes bacterium RBG_16_49_21]
MTDDIKLDNVSESGIDRELVEIIDYNSGNKIINKLTDYAEILTEGKISGIINFNFRLNSVQTGTVLKILEDMQGISRIHTVSLKGSKDLQVEYISNIFSDYENPENSSSYLNLKNIIENRLTHQVQQYNINMGKNSTTLAIPLNELRGHVKTYLDLSPLNIAISTKAQHGIIAASLHDVYATLLNRQDYWNDKLYIKFFFNEDDPAKKNILLLRREKRLLLREIAFNIKQMLDKLHAIQYSRMQASREASESEAALAPALDYFARHTKPDAFTDRMLLTPFGKQYGSLIEKIIGRIFDPDRKDSYDDASDDAAKEKIILLYKTYKLKMDMAQYKSEIIDVVDYLLDQDYGIKTFMEKFLGFDRRDQAPKSYTENNQEHVEQFLAHIFTIYFEEIFSSLFKIIKSMDMKKFACAFIIKRIYITEGDNLTNFGFFFVRIIARIGGIRSQ